MKKKSVKKKLNLNKKQVKKALAKLQKNSNFSNESELEEDVKAFELQEIAEEIKNKTPENFKANNFEPQINSSFNFRTSVLRTESLPSNQQEINLEETIAEAPSRTENRERRMDYSVSPNAPNYLTNRTQENIEERYESRIEAPVLNPVRTRQQTGNFFIDPSKEWNLTNENRMPPELIWGEGIEQNQRAPLEENREKYQQRKLNKKFG